LQTSMYLLIPYDVRDDKRRREVEKVLLLYGRRVNYSVFEVEVRRAKMKKLIKELEEASDKKEDHIRIYILGKESLSKSFVLHSNEEVFGNEELYF